MWQLRLGDNKASDRILTVEVAVQAFSVAVIPLAIYIGLFYLHLSILTKAGAHDNLMTSAFQVNSETLGLQDVTCSSKPYRVQRSTLQNKYSYFDQTNYKPLYRLA